MNNINTDLYTGILLIFNTMVVLFIVNSPLEKEYK
ncbi:hypothetical protein TEGL_19820 [Terrisporobacter glycolicus ATCC 14880 = DSM 1288]|uniref:Uncharacterized protein n=1 Tax=Terrisporobacter glycolicus ATCC 14880 = DSM 1288 TaxID=1121315 RepID=A0ABZ2EVS3_9FIRM